MKKIAVIGVMNSHGRELLNILEENNTSPDDLFAVDTDCPLGTQVSYGEEYDIDVFNLRDFDFSSAKTAVFCTSEEIAKHYIPRALAKGAFVIDCSGAYALDSDVPLIIPQINSSQIKNAHKGIVALPSPLVLQTLIPLQKINENNSILRIVINAYMPASTYGKEAMDELFAQTRKIFLNEPLVDDEQIFHKQIAFNALPQVGEFIGDETKYEWETAAEIKKILNENIKIHANCAFIPSFIGVGAFVNVECQKDVDVDDIRNFMRDTENVVVFDKHVDCGYVSVNDVQGEKDVYISRMRQDISVENGFSYWCVADDLRFGTAENAYTLLKIILKN